MPSITGSHVGNRLQNAGLFPNQNSGTMDKNEQNWGSKAYWTTTVMEKLVSLPVTVSQDLRYTAVIFWSPLAVAEISQVWVPPEPTIEPDVSEGTYVSFLT